LHALLFRNINDTKLSPPLLTFSLHFIGVSAEVAGDRAVLLAGFPSMFSVDFCGSKAADFFGVAADAMCIILPDVDLFDTLYAHDQFFRRIFTKFNSRLTKQSSPSLVLLVRSPTVLDVNVKEKALVYLSDIWKDINPTVSKFLQLFVQNLVDILK
jgi:hypothetical protein